MIKLIICSSLLIILTNVYCSGQDSIPLNSNCDSIQVDKIDFLNYKIDNLNTIVSLQSQSIENLNLMIQLLNIEILELKQEVERLKEVDKGKKSGVKSKHLKNRKGSEADSRTYL